jgi:hypothetical protein
MNGSVLAETISIQLAWRCRSFQLAVLDIDGCLAKQQKQREIARNRGQSAKHEGADGRILDGSDQIRVRLRAISGHKSGFC